MSDTSLETRPLMMVREGPPDSCTLHFNAPNRSGCSPDHDPAVADVVERQRHRPCTKTTGVGERDHCAVRVPEPGPVGSLPRDHSEVVDTYRGEIHSKGHRR